MVATLTSCTVTHSALPSSRTPESTSVPNLGESPAAPTGTTAIKWLGSQIPGATEFALPCGATETQPLVELTMSNTTPRAETWEYQVEVSTGWTSPPSSPTQAVHGISVKGAVWTDDSDGKSANNVAISGQASRTVTVSWNFETESGSQIPSGKYLATAGIREMPSGVPAAVGSARLSVVERTGAGRSCS